MLDAWLKGKFYSKCKTGIRVTKTRLDLIRRKRKAMQKYLKNDIADLLMKDLNVNAYGRSEGLLLELNLSRCYDLLDQYCQQISSNLSAMNKQRECPEDCKEAVSTLMFAAARFADLPELRDLRTIFADRYGKSIDFFVNKEFVEKLKGEIPSKEMKLQLIQEIASECSIEWDSKALEQNLYKPPAATDEPERAETHLSADTNPEKEEESDVRAPLHYNSIPPPYTKPPGRNKKADLKEENGIRVEYEVRAEPIAENRIPIDFGSSRGETLPKGNHLRAASCNPDGWDPKPHVHPKLPDYDDLIARLAAARSQQK
ncbi:unnamed protein product [Cuscuta campestris]|uniref:IST1-like protein n=1 Tax=Cuscuta campestris TaxID=132261 RepID=A0A484MJT8_9ASTE|nr:unnamed protein product [Cuscuta campestris]